MAQLKHITKNSPESPYEKKYVDDDAIRDVIAYAYNDEKTQGYIGGWAIDPRNAAYEMELVAILFNNFKGVRLRHWCVFFEEHELQKLEDTLKCDRIVALFKLGYQLSAYYKDQYQIVFAVHWDSEHPHLHFVMNSVSYVDGRKFSGSKSDYYNYERYVKIVATSYGLTLYTVKDHQATKNYHSN